jgi:hypothetical protein
VAAFQIFGQLPKPCKHGCAPPHSCYGNANLRLMHNAIKSFLLLVKERTSEIDMLEGRLKFSLH